MTEPYFQPGHAVTTFRDDDPAVKAEIVRAPNANGLVVVRFADGYRAVRHVDRVAHRPAEPDPADVAKLPNAALYAILGCDCKPPRFVRGGCPKHDPDPTGAA